MGKKLSRRDFLKLSGASAAALAASSANFPVLARAMASRQSATEISFMGWGATAEDNGVKAAIAEFEKQMPNITVDWIFVPDASANSFVQTFLTSVAAGTPPDTSFVRSDSYETFRTQGLLMDITDRITADPELGKPDYFFPQEAQRSADANGRWHGIGSTWVAPHLYFNADMLDKAGIPAPGFQDDEIWDWDTFIEYAKQLTTDANGRHPDDAGFDPDNIEVWAVDWQVWWVYIFAAIFSNGGSVVDPNDPSKLVLDSPEAIEALQRLADLRQVHHVAPAHDAVLANLGMTNEQMLNSGKLAMLVGGSWQLAWTNPTTMDQITMGTGALPKMKQPASYMQAHFHSIMSGTQHPEEAWQWLRFLNTPFYETQFMKIGLWLPSQTALGTEDGLKTWITEGIHPANYPEFVTDYLPKYGQTFRVPAGYSEADPNFITPAFQAVDGGASAADTMPAAIQQANDVLAQAAASS
jgi:multiple sugar transport system substrate-binding protein